jgi:hypothetical protein
MDHEQAAAIKAAERYVLDELSPAERDEFEDHYFCCQACAEQLRETAAFADNAAAVFRSRGAAEFARAREPFWAAWLRRPQWAFAAALAFLILAAAELIYIRGLRVQLAAVLAPQAVLSNTLQPVTRSEGNRIAVPQGSAFFEVAIDVDPEAQATAYTYEIRTAAGELVARGPAAAPPPGAPINLLLPAGLFRAGSYALTLKPAGSAVPPQEFRFIIVR